MPAQSTASPAALHPLPGLEVVGRGVYLRPYKPFELKSVLFERTNPRVYASPETGEEYEIPAGYEVNTSPPMPGGRALNQVTIEESFERFQKKFELDASAAVGSGPFAVDASASQMSELRSEQEAFYAVRNSCVPLWAVYLPNSTNDSTSFEVDVPVPFKHAHRAAYEKFFERYGTHYVKRAWVGGKASLTFTVVKSSNMTKEAISAGLQASYAGAGGSVNVKNQQAKEQLLSNSACTVFGKGGNESRLAALSSLDEAAYNEWLSTVPQNPQTIEMEVAGIWKLVDNPEQAQALMTAYREATRFKPVAGAFAMGDEVYFFRGDRFTLFNRETGQTDKPKLLRERWPELSEYGYERADATLRGDYVKSADGEDLSKKLYLFKRHWCLRLDLETGQVDEGYPKAVSDEFPGLMSERIDAAFNAGPKEIYFFTGPDYVRFDIANHRVDEGYPQRTAERWVGVTFDRIDGVLYAGNGKAMFFRDDQHLRFDMVTYRTDPGYPKAIVGSYVEDWKFFD